MITKNIEIKAIIIEDLSESQIYLNKLLKKNFDSISVKGFATNIPEAIKLINNEKPELIFADIELKDGLSFEIFSKISHFDFEVIFITAYETYLKQAIDHYAFSYINKPFTEEELTSKVFRYINLKERLFTQQKLEMLKSLIANEDSKILIHLGQTHELININDIYKLEANGNDTYIYLDSNKRLLASYSLKHYQQLLTNKPFFKASRSILININKIKSIYKKESIIMTNKEIINISTRNRPNLSEILKRLS
jgi:two-component system LytT family response regulator